MRGLTPTNLDWRDNGLGLCVVAARSAFSVVLLLVLHRSFLAAFGSGRIDDGVLALNRPLSCELESCL